MIKGLIREIREQPIHIRTIFMWLMVVVTFSGVAFLYVRSTQNQVVALLGSGTSTAVNEGELDQGAKTTKSPFALIVDSFSSLRANIFEFVKGSPVVPKASLRQQS